MKLALSIGYSGAQMALPVARVQRAEALGYHSVWTAEAYGSDALSPLAYLAAVTQRIKLGRRHHPTRGANARECSNDRRDDRRDEWR